MKRTQYFAFILICILGIILLYATFNRGIKSIDFETYTGERIKVNLLTGNDKELKVKNSGFAVTKDQQEIVEGVFISIDEFQSFKELVNNKADIERLNLNVIENNDIEILYWTYIASADDNSMLPDVTYIKLITNKTAVICHSSLTLEDAKVGFNCLGFMLMENIDIEPPAINNG